MKHKYGSLFKSDLTAEKRRERKNSRAIVSLDNSHDKNMHFKHRQARREELSNWETDGGLVK